MRPKRVVGDKGYSSSKIRCYLRRRGIRYSIPRKENEKHRGKFDKMLYRQRNRVERCFNRLKQFRRIATRYEKKAENYLAMLAQLPSSCGCSFKTRPSTPVNEQWEQTALEKAQDEIALIREQVDSLQ